MTQHMDALAQANARRLAISQFLVNLHSLPRVDAIEELSYMLDTGDGAAQLAGLRIERALLAVHGIGTAQADRLLAIADIHHRYLRDVTREQCELLAGLLRAEVKR